MVKLNKKLGIAGLALAGLLIGMILIAGCTSGTGTPSQTTNVPTTVASTPVVPSVTPAATTAPGTAPSSGTIKVTGSTTVLPIAQAAADAFLKLNPNANIQVSGGGSGVGVQAIGEKTVDIGMSSREVTPAEMAKYPGFVITPVSLDGLTIIVNANNNPVNSLSLAQLQNIYNGTITNWKDVGGKDMAIVVIGRDSASGSRTFFTDTVMKGKNYVSTMFEKNSNGAIEQSVGQTPGAIGYTGLGFNDPTIKQLKINVNGTLITPSVATVLDKSYPLSRYLYMITNGQPTGLTRDYINYILSTDGQKIVAAQGFVPLPNATPLK
ncbi:MAG TPA: phosphate ABC transporter substrate-binding protein [Methanoregulaceae archaeon]|nr:phosphate ABC transporter substrate-binding protein [Methanoregulaceae archaeon]